jgi:hypothetical protein
MESFLYVHDFGSYAGENHTPVAQNTTPDHVSLYPRVARTAAFKNLPRPVFFLPVFVVSLHFVTGGLKPG